jgi:arylsulfatase A-like enzyme
MNRFYIHVRRSVGALVLLETIQVVLTVVALAYVYREQVLPPYGFFPNQVYDFVAKLRYVTDPLLGWLPSLPDHFHPTPTLGHFSVVLELLPAGLAMAVVIGAIGGIVGGLLGWRRLETLRQYLLLWAVVGLIVHAFLAILPMQLGENPPLARVFYRMRSLIVDGTAVALTVFAASLAFSFLASGALARRERLGVGLAALAAIVGGSFWIVAGSGVDVSVASSRVAESHRDGEHVNVLLISLDSLRADHVGCYGYERDTSPHLDRFAAEGIRFANAVSTSSWTLPTHLTMFTGRYQLSHGVVRETYTLSPSVPTAGEIFKANGYTTAGFVSAPFVAAHYGYARGMDIYEDLSASYENPRDARSAIAAPEINEMALRWLDDHAEDQFFLFLHYFDVHYDYIPPAPYNTMFDPDYRGTMDGRNFMDRSDVNSRMDKRDLEHIVALYDGEIRFTDAHVGEILRKIDALGLRDKTLVVIVADHGEEFFEHKNKGHHRTLYDEVLKVPMLVRLPDGSHAGTIVEDPVSLVDLLPTMLDVARVDAPGEIDGLSMLPLTEGRQVSRAAIYGAFFDKPSFNLQVTRRTAHGKVIQHFNRITHPRRHPVEYYDLADDPGERRNLVSERRAEVVEQLDSLAGFLDDAWSINQHLASAAKGENRIELDSATVERLKSLGYME